MNNFVTASPNNFLTPFVCPGGISQKPPTVKQGPASLQLAICGDDTNSKTKQQDATKGGEIGHSDDHTTFCYAMCASPKAGDPGNIKKKLI